MYLFEIDIPLPFLLPVEKGNTLESHYSYGNFLVKFEKKNHRFKPHERKRLISLLKIKFNSINNKQFDELSTSDATQDLFLLSLEHVNLLLNAFSSTIPFSGVYTITVNDLPPVIYINYQGNRIAYMTNPHGIIDSHFNDLTQKELMPILEKFAQWTNYPELALPDKLLEEAKYNMLKDQNTMAVIGFQTSMEVFLSVSMKIILLKEGKSDAEVEAVLNYPFRNMVEQHLARKLNLNLNFTDPNNTIVFTWYNKLYSLRNSIVHSGLTNIPTIEARESFVAYRDLRNTIGTAMVTQGYLDSYGQLDLGIFNRDFNTEEMKKIIASDLKKMGINKKESVAKWLLKMIINRYVLLFKSS